MRYKRDNIYESILTIVKHHKCVRCHFGVKTNYIPGLFLNVLMYFKVNHKCKVQNFLFIMEMQIHSMRYPEIGVNKYIFLHDYRYFLI